MPSQYQGPDDQGSLSQAVEVFASGPEMSPYASLFVPPYPEAMIPGNTGYAVVGDGTNGGGGGSGSAATFPIPVVSGDVVLPFRFRFRLRSPLAGAGDTFTVQFFFPGVCWVDVDPVLDPARPDGITWEYRTWQAQVRGDKLVYGGYWWPPAYPVGPWIQDFVIDATWKDSVLPSMEDPKATGPGTWVTLLTSIFWPGDWVWDLQSIYYLDPVLQPTLGATRTWVAGKATILIVR